MHCYFIFKFKLGKKIIEWVNVGYDRWNDTRKRVGKTIARSHSISRLFPYKGKFKSNLVLSLVDN